jgi:hypothetical protein
LIWVGLVVRHLIGERPLASTRRPTRIDRAASPDAPVVAERIASSGAVQRQSDRRQGQQPTTITEVWPW